MCKYLECRKVAIKGGRTRMIACLVTGRKLRRFVVRVKQREGDDRERGTGTVDGTILDQR